MRKLILQLLLFLLVIANSGLKSQSLAIIYNQQRINNGTVVQVTGEINSNPFYEVVAHARVLNLTNRSVEVRAKRIIVDTVPGTENYLCWVQCFPPQVDVALQPYTINAGDTTANDIFGGHYLPKSKPGKTTITYEFWVEGTPEDKAFFTVEFIVQAASLPEQGIRLGMATPNPANDWVRIDYQIGAQVTNASIRIQNLMGQVVLEQPISAFQGTVRLPLSGLNEGIYFYSLMINNQVSTTRKFVIRR